ncbi:MAG: acyl-CoA dehydrogenase family protein, partial [Burkholderiales bacterium]
MDFALTEDQRMMVDAAKSMVNKHLQPILDAESPDRPLPKSAAISILKHCAAIGIIAARVPENGGGAGMKLLDYGLMTEQLPLAVANVLQPQETTITRLYHGTTGEQRERILPALMAGEKITCTATTEPDVGSDPRGVKTRLTKE